MLGCETFHPFLINEIQEHDWSIPLRNHITISCTETEVCDIFDLVSLSTNARALQVISQSAVATPPTQLHSGTTTTGMVAGTHGRSRFRSLQEMPPSSASTVPLWRDRVQRGTLSRRGCPGRRRCSDCQRWLVPRFTGGFRSCLQRRKHISCRSTPRQTRWVGTVDHNTYVGYSVIKWSTLQRWCRFTRSPALSVPFL